MTYSIFFSIFVKVYILRDSQKNLFYAYRYILLKIHFMRKEEIINYLVIESSIFRKQQIEKYYCKKSRISRILYSTNFSMKSISNTFLNRSK